MIVGAVCCTAITMIFAVRVMVTTYGGDAAVNPSLAIIIALCSALVGAGLGAMLGIKDRVQQRMARGVYVGPLMRSLFGSGGRSVAIWLSLVFVCAFFMLPVLLILGLF